MQQARVSAIKAADKGMRMSILRNIARTTIVLCIAGIAITGCGRKGELDKPSTPVEQQNQRKSAKTQAAPVADTPFLLDPLL
jgi:predicted small lipoprotein YifL